MLNALRIENFSVQVHLGCEKEERIETQEVRVSAEFRFKELVKGAQTDELKDALCYAQACDLVRQIAQKREYKLIERLGFDCFLALKEWAGPDCQIALRIHKVQPPVQNLLGGSVYQLGDFWL